MTNMTNSSGSLSPNQKTLTVPTTMSSAFSDTASMVSSAVNMPEGHPVSRAVSKAGDIIPHAEKLFVHHVASKLRQASISTNRTALSDGGASSSPLRTQDTTATEYVPEHSFWGDDAENAVRAGLLKLKQLADDYNKYEPEKSMEEHFSERLSKLINECGIKFDPKDLN